MDSFLSDHYENKKKETLLSFIQYCIIEKECDKSIDIFNNKITKPKSQLLSLFSNETTDLNDTCIIWNGPVAKTKLKNGISISPIININISKNKTIQLSAKQLSLFLFSRKRIKKRYHIQSSCFRKLCVNPLHLKRKENLRSKKRKV